MKHIDTSGCVIRAVIVSKVSLSIITNEYYAGINLALNFIPDRQKTLDAELTLDDP